MYSGNIKHRNNGATISQFNRKLQLPVFLSYTSEQDLIRCQTQRGANNPSLFLQYTLSVIYPGTKEETVPQPYQVSYPQGCSQSSIVRSQNSTGWGRYRNEVGELPVPRTSQTIPSYQLPFPCAIYYVLRITAYIFNNLLPIGQASKSLRGPRQDAV